MSALNSSVMIDLSQNQSMQLPELMKRNALELLGNRNVVWTLVTILSFVAWMFLGSLGEPTKLSDPIPGVYNTVQFLTNNEKFMKRVMLVLLSSPHIL